MSFLGNHDRTIAEQRVKHGHRTRLIIRPVLASSRPARSTRLDYLGFSAPPRGPRPAGHPAAVGPPTGGAGQAPRVQVERPALISYTAGSGSGSRLAFQVPLQTQPTVPQTAPLLSWRCSAIPTRALQQTRRTG